MSADLQQIIGRQFTNPELLERALTHKSRARENTPEQGQADNEQLEFLGDAILGFFVTDALVAEHPTWPEGRLSRVKAWVVSAAHLYEVAQSVGLGNYLRLGRGEELTGGREKPALLADAVEALIAALYLDGGIEAARSFVDRHILAGMPLLDVESAPITNHKSALQELARTLNLPQPRYFIVEERGPEHAKTFTVEVRLGPDWLGRADGLSKKSASQEAARLLLAQLLKR